MTRHALARVCGTSARRERVGRWSARPVAVAHPLWRLQRSIGNLAIQRLFGARDSDTPHYSVAPSMVDEVLRSSGQPLDTATRSFMEHRFNHDFAGVRVHTYNRAAESARAVDAAAYTVGNHVVFGTGRHAPESHAGRRLLAHELTHVVQQTPSLHRQPERDPEAAKEKEEADKARVEECLKQKTELLPKVGVVEHINRDVGLNEILGKDRQTLETQIRADPDARRLVCEAGVGAIMALFYNRDYHNRLSVRRARDSFSRHPKFYSFAGFDLFKDTKELLKTKYGVTTEAGDKGWSPEDIGLLAEALRRLTDREMPLIRGYRFVRWTSRCNQRRAEDADYECVLKDYQMCGLHEAEIARWEKRITLYDCFKTDPKEFAKLKYRGRPGAETIIHEIGHAMAGGRLRLALERQADAKRELERLKKQADTATTTDAKVALATKLAAAKQAVDKADKAVKTALSPSVLDRFAKLIKGKPALTPYSNINTSEAFAEAFMLFKVAPKKLKKANEKLFKWFKKGRFL
jgi:Domain of unknown function (DUF4157)